MTDLYSLAESDCAWTAIHQLVMASSGGIFSYFLLERSKAGAFDLSVRNRLAKIQIFAFSLQQQRLYTSKCLLPI